jgi:glycosyltransferase involved in cell wall biosynthesis
MKAKVLSIVVPAYNEEEAIKSTIERMIKAKEKIVKATDISDVELIVVNDGSRDSTPAIAGEYASRGAIKLISYEKNKGYGAAIKEGFASAKGDYLGFFDADGTCDPDFFIDLYRTLEEKGAGISIGSRMHKDSKMPPVRRIGNGIYVRLINILWRTKITDSASGMRLLRREAFETICPLPDGLHFTPVMTCKALSTDNMKIVELPMSYSERKGRSKLSIIKDGYRFLMMIFEMGFSYRPFAFFGTIGMFFMAAAAAYGIPVVWYYALNREIPEYMIYRIIAVVAAVIVGSILFFINLIMQDFIAYAKNKDLVFEKSKNRFLRGVAKPENMMAAGAIFMFLSVLFNMNSLFEYLATGRISQHWIHTMTGAFLFIEGTIMFVFGVALHIIHVYKKKI